MFPGTCRSYGACSLPDGEFYKHDAPMALKRAVSAAAKQKFHAASLAEGGFEFGERDAFAGIRIVLGDPTIEIGLLRGGEPDVFVGLDDHVPQILDEMELLGGAE